MISSPHAPPTAGRDPSSTSSGKWHSGGEMLVVVLWLVRALDILLLVAAGAFLWLTRESFLLGLAGFGLTAALYAALGLVVEGIEKRTGEGDDSQGGWRDESHL